ncbi:MAG: hypothetical protein IPL42_08395 [Saprospiraceae bacterium]|nr:hypothetical protein [Saprospiraceae bacterium]
MQRFCSGNFKPPSKNKSNIPAILIGAIINIAGLLITLYASGSLPTVFEHMLIILGICMVSMAINTMALLRVQGTKNNFEFGIFFRIFFIWIFNESHFT